MKVLVTGATGFIGSFVAEKLLAKGYDVRCIIRSTSNLRWLTGKNYELTVASLSDVNSLKKATDGVDYIYHLAGNTSAKNLDAYMEGNCNSTLNLIEAALCNAPNLKRFTHISSQTAAGPALSANEPTNEDMPLNPITDYGKSKQAAEYAIHQYVDRLPFTIIRPSAVYGPRDTEIFSIFKMIKMGLIAYIGFDKKLLSLIHVDDLSDGIIESAESRNTIGKTYFISSDTIYNWADIYSIIKQALGKKHCLSIHLPNSLVRVAGGISGLLGSFSAKPPVFNYQKAIDFIQPYWICSTKSAAKDFGYKQKIFIEDGIHSTIQWYKQMKWL